MTGPAPLKGVRVVDFTHVLAGPACGYMLGLLGAEVIKVESPRGDAMRWRGGTDRAAARDGRSTAWATQAAGKRSVVLDLDLPEDRRVMNDLLASADVLVENHLPPTLERLGLTALDTRFPSLIHCAMTGYGRGSEMADAPAYDVNIQAACGLMTMTGTKETGPLRTGAPVMDYGTALSAGFAICAALYERRQTGRGAFLDVSMFDTALTLMASAVTDMTMTGHVPQPRGNAANSRSPTAGTFPCRTGLLSLGVNEERHFAALALSVGRAAWLDDPRFATRGARTEHADALADDLIAALSTDDAPAWEERLRRAGVAVSVLRRLDEAVALPHVRERGVLHPLPGGGYAPGLPFRFGADRLQPAQPPAPLGTDTDRVRAELAASAMALAAPVSHLHVQRSDTAPTRAPHLVFVNFLGCDLRIWDGVVTRLSAEFRIIRYDKRGHGLSNLLHPPYSLADHAEDLAALIETTPGPAIVCGLSIGGMIAMQTALDRPDLIRGLILSDTAAWIGTPERYIERERAIRRGGMARFADTQIDRWFSTAFRGTAPGTVARMRNMLTRQSVEGYLGSVATLRDADLSDAIRAIACPTHCVTGALDVSTPPTAVRALADAIPGASYAEIPEAGHLPCLEAPEAFATELRRAVAAFRRQSDE